ncbi:MAG TPA: SAM-dependent methyltransferase, partial [Streptosporangiaceae bacterium]
INADLRRPESVLRHPDVTALLDFSEPVGVLMVAVLHFVPDSDDPFGVVRGFARALVPGSYLAISHATSEAAPAAAAQVQDLYTSTTASAHTRTRTQIGRFFDGFELVEPGLVYLPSWRPDAGPPEHPERAWFYAGVGRRTGE